MTTPHPLTDGGRRRGQLVLAVCCLSLPITALDTTAVNVALPAVGHDLHASVSGLQWTVDGYTLAVAAFMMLAGSTADRIGRRRVFQAGLALFTAGSLACSLAPTLGWLIAFRVVQGLGASMLNPVALSIITHAFPDPRERTRAIGLWGTTVGLSLAAGPVAGGLLVASAGWRSIFWINIPIGVAALVLAAVFVPESRAATTRRPDPVGQLLVVTILTSLIFAIIEGSRRGYGSTPIIGLFALSAVAVAALPGYERRREQPLVDPVFFRSVPFTGSFVIAVTAFLVLSGFLFLNTLYLQEVRGFSALHAGLLTVPMAAGIALASPLSGRLTAARGPRPPLVAAGLLIAAAALMLTTLAPTTPWAVLLAAYVLLGTGFGLVNTPITSTAVAGMPRSQAGVSAAITTTGRQVGNNLGVAVLGSIVAAHTRAPDHAGIAAASHPGWWVLAAGGLVIAAMGLAITTRRAVATATATRVATRVPTDPSTAFSSAPRMRGGAQA
ncbi:EmrB/QacA subfamily drug resistance transporter [Kitasatospora sp. MAA19]|uniref:MFS transporter n=1 Tax=Kitasatospora sp. MAA19 TaxID=3035090 RepID=UPI0024753634|nr:MFS transporter [Kitasatospora sp. MAA19]MDH6706641.1 EmrB/QacA subfamily drug resistance transporter [Kitasatospora sp. MAA19]